MFIDNTWDVIRNQKELNLPDQRQMVANFRCNEIKQEALELVQQEVNALRLRCEQGIVADFGAQCTSVILKARGYFHENANQYSGVVFQKVEKELLT